MSSKRAIAAFLLASSVLAAGAITLGEQRITGNRASTSGTISAIDAGARSLTVDTPRGQATYRIDPKVKNLESFKPGDAVRVDYVSRVGLTLRRAKDAPVEGAVAPKRGQPVGPNTTIVTRVLGVDKARSTIKLKGPQGHVEEYPVADKADLVGVRNGDEVVIVVYELAVVDLAPARR
ncbi:hypothetical protein LZ009_21995 [Ramlibacter sp. XY19]|uniref:hypothetical protein n=1 Tax=Ramlibacter paludis TaxID=2908000 RepID=UPI0023DCD1BA|nr:hypothetical protein [Ramlibacter paludis]MCG2595459.1 hypothetical protein [Ramlibacter paludis]